MKNKILKNQSTKYNSFPFKFFARDHLSLNENKTSQFNKRKKHTHCTWVHGGVLYYRARVKKKIMMECGD